MQFFKRFLKSQVPQSMIVQCAKMDDKDIITLADRLDRTYKDTRQGDRLRAYLACRKRHFSPSDF